MISQITPAGMQPASRARSIEASVWPGALEHAARARLERVDVAALDDVLRALGRVDGDADRVRAVGGADAGGDALARLDGHGERRLRGRSRCAATSARGRARRSARRSAPGRSSRARGVAMKLMSSAVTNSAAITRSPSFSRSSSSTTTTILPGGDVLQRLLDGGERGRLGAQLSSFSTYLARMSTSRLTGVPGAAAPRLVRSSVSGISETSKEASSMRATVSETPSTVIEPFSTT